MKSLQGYSPSSTLTPLSQLTVLIVDEGGKPDNPEKNPVILFPNLIFF